MRIGQTKFVLYIGFGTILVLLLVMTLTWLQYINTTTKLIEEILEEHEEAGLVFQMRDSAHKRSHILYQMALHEDSFARDSENMSFKAEASKFIEAKEKLVAIGISEAESSLWEKTRNTIVNARAAQRETVELFLSEKDQQATDLLLNEVKPSYDEVLSQLTDMLEFYQDELHEVAKMALVSNVESYRLTLFLGVIIFVIAVSAAWFAISNSVLIERKLIDMQRSAETANQSKSLFLANMSHEIRTPLTVIIGYAEMLIKDKMEENERQDYFGTILRNGKHLLTVINDILDLSKIEANKLEVEIMKVSPFQVVLDGISIMNHSAKRKGLSLESNFQFPYPSEIASDPTKMKQILLNLISNAVKFTESGSIKIDTSFEPEACILTISVTDTGIGMSQEASEQIFKPFSQADASTTRKFGGTGLGLTISRELAQMLGGDLVCKSVIGEGTCFTLKIYCGWVEKESLLLEYPDEIELPSKETDIVQCFYKGDVLVAEDSPDVQRLVSMYLKRIGATVTAVENGKLAVEEAISSDYDLILMDMQMPVMDGIEATKLLRATGYDGNIVALTANAMKEEREDYLAAGINDFLAKPIEINMFNTVVGKHLEKADTPTVFDDSDDEYDELVEQFVDCLPGMLSDLDQDIEQSNFIDIAQIAHKLKGMGGSFGFPEITECAKEIEMAAKKNNIEQVCEKHQMLKEICIGIRK